MKPRLAVRVDHRDRDLGAVLGDQRLDLDAVLLHGLLFELFEPHPLLGARDLVPVRRVGQLIQLAGQLAAPGAQQAEPRLALGPLLLRLLTHRPGLRQRHLQAGERLLHAGDDGLRDPHLRARSGLTLRGPVARLALGGRAPVQRVGAARPASGPAPRRCARRAAPPSRPRAPRWPRRRAGRAARSSSRRPRPASRPRRLLPRVRVRGRRGCPRPSPWPAPRPRRTWRTARPRPARTRLAAEPAELLGHGGLLRVGGPALGDKRVKVLLRGTLLLGRLLELAAQPPGPLDRLGQLLRGLVHRRLDLQQRGRAGGTAVRDVPAEHVALAGDGDQLGPRLEQPGGLAEIVHYGHAVQQPLHRGAHLRRHGHQPGEVARVRRQLGKLSYPDRARRRPVWPRGPCPRP